MAMRDLIPWNRQEGGVPSLLGDEQRSPFFQLRRQMDRLFDDFFQAPSIGRGWTAGGWPSIEVKETDKEVRISAELPGMSDKDVDLSVQDGVMTIRGERKSEHEDRDRGWSERYYGRFERRIGLPDGADEARCKADFRDGVLTVTIPRSAEATRGRKIPINAETRH